MRTSMRVLGSLVAVIAFLGVNAGCKPGKKAVQNRGSDTMVELAQAWSEEYSKVNSAVSVEVSGGGSGVGIAHLTDGKVDIANASRLMSEKELADAKKRTGKDPVLHVVGYDALAVYVHKDNPLEEITMEQLKDVFSSTGKITKWSELAPGLKVPGCDKDNIVLFSRQNNSGTYEYFREVVLGKGGEFRSEVLSMNGSKDLVKSVGETVCSIGYSGMGYKTPAVKFLKVKKDAASPGILPSIAAVHDTSYPISRPLYMYTLGEGTPESVAYMDWVRDDAGQAVCERIGYVPLKPEERIHAKVAPAGASK